MLLHAVVCCAQVYTVTLHGEQLKTDFRVINTGDKPFDFTTALHTYIEVLDVNKAKVRSGTAGTLHCLAIHHTHAVGNHLTGACRHNIPLLLRLATHSST